MSFPFNINFLDHVAVRVSDFEKSVEWYSKILGLDKFQPKEWGDFPIFMWNGQTGVALFPAHHEGTKAITGSIVKIDHFAFNVSGDSFQKAQDYFNRIGEKYDFQDHHFFHSIYLKDPDGHKVELTTKVKDIN